MKSSTNGASRRRARQNGRVDNVGGGAVESMKKPSNQNTRARFRQEISRLLRSGDVDELAPPPVARLPGLPGCPLRELELGNTTCTFT